MQISDITRRNLFDELRIRKINWFGRLDEVEFLGRLYDLKHMRSSDRRFEDLEGDIWQHRINNLDWEEYWWLTDARLEIQTDDHRFLSLLCELVHPVVRPQADEVTELLEVINRHLAKDGWRLVERERISGHPVYTSISVDSNVQIVDEERLGTGFALSQLRKCDEKIARGDYDGAMTASRSLVERVLADIHERRLGVEVRRGGSLKDLYKAIKGTLNLAEVKETNDSMKGMLRSLASFIENLDDLANAMGDRHLGRVTPRRDHAMFCVNSAKTIVAFLLDAFDLTSDTDKQSISSDEK